MSTPIRKLERNLKNTNKFSRAEEWAVSFPEGDLPERMNSFLPVRSGGHSGGKSLIHRCNALKY